MMKLRKPSETDLRQNSIFLTQTANGAADVTKIYFREWRGIQGGEVLRKANRRNDLREIVRRLDAHQAAK
jgi:hypothetical protein